jgi:hypothetical protein
MPWLYILQVLNTHNRLKPESIISLNLHSVAEVNLKNIDIKIGIRISTSFLIHEKESNANVLYEVVANLSANISYRSLIFKCLSY